MQQQRRLGEASRCGSECGCIGPRNRQRKSGPTILSPTRARHVRLRFSVAVVGNWWDRLAPSPQAKGKVLKRDLIPLGELKVSPMGIGTWAWGNKFLWGYKEEMDQELQDVFNLCLSRGVNLFDTADSYGTGALNGRSEELLGRFMAEYPGTPPHEPVIASKFAAYPWRITRGSMLSAARASAQRLQQPSVDIGQLHWSTANYQPLQEKAMWGGLVDMYEAGAVRAVGVSNYGPKQLKRIHKCVQDAVGTATGSMRDFASGYLTDNGVPLVSVQIQYSLLSQTPEAEGAAAACRDLGLQMIAYSPLALGILSGRFGGDGGRPLPKGPRGQLFKAILPGMEPLYSALDAVCEERGKTMSQVAINWCMSKGTIPIPGAKNLEQAEKNLGALGWRLSDGEVAELDAASRRVPKQMVQNVFMTK